MKEHKLNIQDLDNLTTNVLGGNATITLESSGTGAYYTFKIKKNKQEENMFFVSLLTGPDNHSSYSYMGCIFDRSRFTLTKKSKYTKDSIPVKAFVYFFNALIMKDEKRLAKINVYHAGTCNRCGRKLTTPDSVEIGLGPTCRMIS